MGPTLRSIRMAALAAGALAAGCLHSGARPPEGAEVAANATNRPKSDDERMQWWREARFGLFLHWGLYAIPAGEWNGATGHGEWIRESAHIPVQEYEKFQKQWNPVKFDADAWARLAKQAGMRYVVITSKHHDGYCNFDSALTDWDVMGTPFKRDVMKELADACRRAGLRICWYHSIMDWHHPDYLPRRSWEIAQRPADGADFQRFREYLHGQVTELLTKYGPIGVMWFDGEWESTWKHEYGVELYKLCRTLQPDVIVNNRVDVGREGMQGMTKGGEFVGDFGTPEQEIPATGLSGVDWETCMTMNDHWGYNSHDQDWKSSEDLIRKLVDIASKGGNFLLNVGPRADGTFPEACVERLKAIGAWMDVNGDAIHGTTASPFGLFSWGRCTVKREPGRSESGAREPGRTRLFLHVFERPASGKLVLPGLANATRRAFLLAAPDKDLAVARAGDDVTIALPEKLPDPIATVVALEIEGAPLVYGPPRVRAAAREFLRSTSVELAPATSELDVRYTLDGSEPTAASPRFERPITLEKTTVVQARSFHGAKAVGPIVAEVFTQVKPRASLFLKNAAPGFVRDRYHGDWDRLPDFDQLRSDASEVAPTIALPSGPAEERTGYRFHGFLNVERDEVWTFELTSDDGARLFVDENLVVDNDGLHGARTESGHVALAAGYHQLCIDWLALPGFVWVD